MSSEVSHGPKPKWTVALAKGRYGLELHGRYTKVDGWTAVGVKRVRWCSNRPVKRRSELLGMRTAFVTWFLAQWLAEGGKWTDGIRALTSYPFARLRRELKKGKYGVSVFKR
jgi:hypothetical protein